MNRLQHRVAIVTGGGDGIGRGIARRFAAEGAKVLIAEVNENAGTAVAEELVNELGADARSLRTDVSDKAAVLAMVDEARQAWGTVDILVNNAWGGAGGLGRVENRSDEDMTAGMAVGLYGPLWAMQAAFPLMRAQGRGNIVNLCSLNGVNAHIGGVTRDAMTKFSNLTRFIRTARTQMATVLENFALTLVRRTGGDNPP